MAQGWTPVDEGATQGWTPVAEASVAQPPLESKLSQWWGKVTAPVNPNVSDSNPLTRFLDTAGGAMLSVPGQIYHAFKDEPTPEEQEEFKGHTRIPGELPIERLTSAPLVRGVESWLNPQTRPTFSQAVSVLPEALGTGVGTTVGGEKVSGVLGKAAKIPGTAMAAVDVMRNAAARDIGFKQMLLEGTHATLQNAARRGAAKIAQAGDNLGARVGRISDDIHNADMRDGGDAIVNDNSFIDTTRSKFMGGAGEPAAKAEVLPQFEKAAALLNSEPGPLSWERASAMKSTIGKLANDAVEGSKDEAAISELAKNWDSKLKARASDLGMSKAYDSYNGLWRTWKSLENPKHPLGKLMNMASDNPAAPANGAGFFEVLRDPANGAMLRDAQKTLSKFGLPDDFINQNINKYGDLHDYARTASGQVGIQGRFKSVLRHPLAASVGGVLGSHVLGGPGSVIGAVKGAQLVDAIKAARELRDTGGIAPVKDLAQNYDYQPSGEERITPPSGPDPQLKADLISALRHQGFDAATAKASAIRAIQGNPTGELGDLFVEALRSRR